MVFFTLDRFEENFAVLENRKTKEMKNVERSLLPSDAKEGDILLFENDTYVIDTSETERAKQEIIELMKRMKKS